MSLRGTLSNSAKHYFTPRTHKTHPHLTRLWNTVRGNPSPASDTQILSAEYSTLPRKTKLLRGTLSHSANILSNSASHHVTPRTHNFTPRTLDIAEHTTLSTEDCLQPRLYPVTTQLLRDSKTPTPRILEDTPLYPKLFRTHRNQARHM